MKIRRLQEDDLTFAQQVREVAGWNQTRRDWLRFLETDPDGSFLAEVNGSPAGTAATINYASALAWIGMVLVHPGFRRKGVATALLEHCLHYLLEERDIPCVKLDATPAGLKVYEKMGFQPEYELSRWEGKTCPTDNVHRPRFEKYDLENSLALDRKAFGAERRAFLDLLAADSLRHQRRGGGFAMMRPGKNAHYLGPAIAPDLETGESLVVSILRFSRMEPVYWDIPEDNEPAVALAGELGFVKQRPLIRMWTGQTLLPSDPILQWAISGPETG